jgi:hypothetical protein
MPRFRLRRAGALHSPEIDVEQGLVLVALVLVQFAKPTRILRVCAGLRDRAVMPKEIPRPPP